MLGIAPSLSRAMLQRLREAAGHAGIAVQTEVMSDRTGTNADRMVQTAGGIPCGLISIPLRNMHTAAEVVCLADIEQNRQAATAAYAEGAFAMADLITLLEELCLLPGPSGDEGAVREYILRQIDGYATWRIDPLGNIIAEKRGRRRASKTRDGRRPYGRGRAHCDWSYRRRISAV